MDMMRKILFNSWYKYKEIDAGEIDKKVKKRFDCDSSNKTKI